MVDAGMWSQLGPAGLVSVIVMLVVLGFLIPRWTVNRWLKDRDEQITYHKSMLDKRDEQIAKLLHQGELTVRLLEEIKAASKTGAGSGHV